MKKILILFAALMLVGITKAQLSGVVTVPGTYTSIAAAISDLNLQGVNGALTVNIAAGYNETAPNGGYFLTATGTAANPITFKKNGIGANPLITAYTGTATPGTANLQDGVWTLVGSDYITIDGIDLSDPNTTNPATMEYGYGLFKASATNGSQNNTIRNCVITLSRNNNATGTGPSFDGSRGINLTNATINAQTTNLAVTAATGSNSNNRFYNNVIQNVNIGIALSGFLATSPFTLADTGNDVGGTSAATSNTIINFGGGGTTSPAAAIRTIYQYDFNASYNFINNNNGTGINHATTIRGIFVNTAAGANASINNNTLTIHSNVTTSQVSLIENASGTTANNNTVSVNNNLITGCTNTLATTSTWYGIYNTGSPLNLSINNNIFTNNNTNATSGVVNQIYSSGTPAGDIDISNNTFAHDFIGTVASSGSRYSIYASAASGATLNINSNIFNQHNYTTTRTGIDYHIFSTGTASVVNMNNNNWNNLTYNHSGTQYFLYPNTIIQTSLAVNSNTINNINRTASAGATYFIYTTAGGNATSGHTIANNLMSNYTSTVSGTGLFYGIYTSGGTSPYPKKDIYNNVLNNLNINGSGTCYGIYVTAMGEGSTTSGSQIYNNLLNNITRSGTTYGLFFSTLSSPNFANSVYTNTVSNLVTNGPTSNIYAANLACGSTSGGLIFRNNKLYDISCVGGTNFGLFCTTTSTTTISNNLIGNFNVTSSSGTNRLNGIYLNAGNNYRIYFNSVYLNGTSSGIDFGSNGIYASTTPSVLLQNNIIVNNSTPTGLGISAAYRRSSATLTSYSNLSNNNLFYAGVPSATTVIFHDGTNAAQTLGAFQGIVGPADGLSVTENPTFVSTTGNNPNFLNINTVTPTQIESAGTPVTGISTDYIGTTRNVTTPDIGAWEGNYTLLTCSGTPSAGIAAISASLGCSGNPFNVSTSNQSVGAGITYQWLTAPSATGPWSSIPNATTSIHTTTSNVISFYQLVVTCSVSAQSATTSPVSYTPTNCYNMSNATITACSGLLFDSGGPAAAYANNENYTLTIVPSTPGAMAQLNFNNFSVETCCDYLQIYDGNSTAAPLIGQYTTLPPAITATNITGALTLRFFSDGSVVNPGFEAVISCFLPPTCSATPNSGTATVSSPTSCINTGVTLGATGLDGGLGIQYQWFSAPSASGPWTAIPSATVGSFFTTATVTTFYQIVTTCTVSAQSATSSVVSYTPSNCYTMNNGTITTCSSSLYDTGGPFNNYQDNENYTLTIVPSTPGGSVQISFNSFAVETCCDYLQIYDGANTAAPLIGQYTALPPTITASNALGVLTLRFFSDGSIVQTGFDANLTCTVSCAGPPAAPSATGATICSGNTATLTASPSSSGTAQWYSSATSTNYIAQGSSFVTPVLNTNTTYYVLDSTSCGLSTLTAVNVSVIPTPTLNVNATHTTICMGGSSTLTASGVNSYTWNTSATTSVIVVTPTTTTTYTVDGFSSQCNILQSQIITVNVNALPSVSLSAAVSTICVMNGSISLSGSPSGGIYSGSAVTGSLLSVANAGTFTPMYSYTNTLTGCSNSATTQVIVSNCTGVDEAGYSTNGIRVYPNPNTGTFMIETNNVMEKTIEVMDVTGRVVISEKSESDRILMNISNLANGIYQVRIISEKGVDMIKVIKQ